MKAIKKRIFDIIEIGNKNDWISTGFDFFIVIVIFLNLFATLAFTFDEAAGMVNLLNTIELLTVVIFTIEYILRLWTAEFLYPELSGWRAVFRFVFSFYGLIDLFTFFPYYLPFLFPMGLVAFRLFRVIRIFRLFKINSQYDAFNVITSVLKEKYSQIMWSMCLILMLMVASSLCMYGFEHDAQPEVFRNAFSGIWWSVSTLLTVGYGDIYPVTVAGRILAIFTSFLGVGMVAIPTGIISAGFVEQYTLVKESLTDTVDDEFECIITDIGMNHKWLGKAVREVVLPKNQNLVMIVRDEDYIIPRHDTLLRDGDKLVIYIDVD